MQYQFEILRKCHFSSLRSWFLAQHSLINWLSWQQWMTYLQSFNFRNCDIWLPKSDISLAKICWTVFWDIQPKQLKTFYFFSCRILMTTYILTKFHRHLTWNSEVRRGAKMLPPPPPPSQSFQVGKKPSPNMVKQKTEKVTYLSNLVITSAVGL